MRKQEVGLGRLFLVGITACFFLILGTAGTAPAGEETFACVAADQMEQDIVPEAELVNFSCFFQEWKNEKSLHFMVRLKNVSDEEQRFRVNIFLNNGKAVGGLLPRKTKNGLIQPGETVEYAYPVKGMQEKAEGLLVRIRTIGS